MFHASTSCTSHVIRFIILVHPIPIVLVAITADMTYFSWIIWNVWLWSDNLFDNYEAYLEDVGFEYVLFLFMLGHAVVVLYKHWVELLDPRHSLTIDELSSVCLVLIVCECEWSSSDESDAREVHNLGCYVCISSTAKRFMLWM